MEKSLFPASQPASQSNISFLWRVHFLSVQSGSSNCAGLPIFNVPRDNIKYPERIPERPSGQYLYLLFTFIVDSLSSGKVEMFLCASCHAFTPHVNAWKR